VVRGRATSDVTPQAGLSAARIADLLGGQVVGDGSIVLHGVGSLARAGPRDLSFLASGRYAKDLSHTCAGAVLVSPSAGAADAGPATRIVVRDPILAVAEAMRIFYPPSSPAWGIAPSASMGTGARWRGRISLGPAVSIGPRAHLGADCVIEAGACVGEGATLGNGCRIGAHAVVYAGARLGHRVVLGPGARVGGPGFGFVRRANGAERFPHIGGCDIGDDVEIGANTTIDRGKLDATIVGKGTKIDNLVHVGHTVRIGEHCVIMAQVGIAGSSTLDDGVVLAGQAGIADHVTVGRGAVVAAQGGVIGAVPAGATVSGYPARPHREVLREAAALRRLAPLVGDLERAVRP
jgi:UDP-3-O-[3-hydroxymyristoyl] glucosamine N-acyltransferase